ncbi:hypothetical protein [uncultured Clostridium sp.]|nr:hypothetical protein [uncultured Clostridium sp.]
MMTKEQVKEMHYYISNRVREECIKNNWYTNGDTQSYTKMLNRIANDTFDVVDIAENIYEHSSTNKSFNKIFKIIEAIVNMAYNIFDKDEIENEELNI